MVWGYTIPRLILDDLIIGMDISMYLIKYYGFTTYVVWKANSNSPIGIYKSGHWNIKKKYPHFKSISWILLLFMDLSSKEKD